MTFLTTAWDWLCSQALSLPQLAKFTLAMATIVGIPPLSRRVRLPAVVGLLLCGVVLGPHVIGFFGERPHRPIADFFAELGKLRSVIGVHTAYSHSIGATTDKHHASAIFSRAKASFTATERSLRN
jgi:Sodium/hydrogen exchanger family